jgi:hypothetical protein
LQFLFELQVVLFAAKNSSNLLQIYKQRKNRRVKDFWMATVYQKHRALPTTKKDV